MPRRAGIPVPRLHKKSGQARLRLNGREIWLGPWGSSLAADRYQRFLAEWQTSRQMRRPHGEITVNEVAAAYLEHAADYYARPDRPNAHWGKVRVSAIKRMVLELLPLYGFTCAANFGPLALRAFREAFLKGWAARYKGKRSRGYVNDAIAELKRMFRWAASVELIDEAVWRRLLTVEGLRLGRSDAREAAAVKPAPAADLQATLPHLREPVLTMVHLQLLTAMRPGEVVQMSAAEIDRSPAAERKGCWVYAPKQHKNAWRGVKKLVSLGPQAQELLAPFLLRHPEGPLFRPVDAVKAKWREQREARQTKVQPSQRHRKKNHKKKKPGDAYTTASYRRAIAYARAKADAGNWTPNQLRHTRATDLRKRFGLDTARAVLGHESANTTEIYAEIDAEAAAVAMAQAG